MIDTGVPTTEEEPLIVPMSDPPRWAGELTRSAPVLPASQPVVSTPPTMVVPVANELAGYGEPVPVRRAPWYEDRGARVAAVVVSLSLLFLLVAGLIWWAAEDPQDEVLDGGSQAVALAPPESSVPTSSSPESALPMPQAVRADSPVAVPAPVPAAPAPVDPVTPVESTPVESTPTEVAPVAEPPTTVATTVATTTVARNVTNTLAPTTTAAPRVAPTTTVATTVASTVAPSTVASTTLAPTTTAPTTTVASTAPVVTSPQSPNATLLDVIEGTPDLARLRDLVEMTDLAAELDAVEARTFFAPSNEAIEAFAATPAGEALLADPAQVRQLLLRHLALGSLDAETVTSLDAIETVSGDVLAVDPVEGTVDGADLLVVDVSAANGFLHVVSQVLTGA